MNGLPRFEITEEDKEVLKKSEDGYTGDNLEDWLSAKGSFARFMFETHDDGFDLKCGSCGRVTVPMGGSLLGSFLACTACGGTLKRVKRNQGE